jgi:hypothetical protein
MQACRYNWKGPILILEDGALHDDIVHLRIEDAMRFANSAEPHQFFRLEAGKKVPLQFDTTEYMRMRVNDPEEKKAFMMLALKTKRQKVSLGQRIEAFYNGYIQAWQPWSLMAGLSYLKASGVCTYIYVGFQPLVGIKENFNQRKKRRLLTEAANEVGYSLKCKLGFHHVHTGHEMEELKIPLKKTVALEPARKWTLPFSVAIAVCGARCFLFSIESWRAGLEKSYSECKLYSNLH